MIVALITSGGRVTQWQADAVRALGPGNRIIVFDSAERPSRRRYLAHGLYYALNLLAVRNRQTRPVALTAALAPDKLIPFEPIIEGRWQQLPADIVEQIRALRPDCIVKLGMGLLRVPPREQLGGDILSFHHGDPRHFRGRPAGFYELLQGRDRIGQVVQILSDRLDAGRVVAFAETKAYAHSWKQTLIEAFRVSPMLLPQAVARHRAGASVEMVSDGRNYRLPGNGTVVRFVLQRCAAWARRLLYGLFREKAWTVAEAHLPADWKLDDMAPALDEAGLTPWPVARPHIFYADPFFDPLGDGILAEAMRPDGHGEIVTLTKGRARPRLVGDGHLSFPGTFMHDGGAYLLPEMAGWSAPRLYSLTADGAAEAARLRMARVERLVDPILHTKNDVSYLFANRVGDPAGVLRLWTALSPFAEFVEHGASPIQMSPRGGRMAGGLLDRGGQLYRVGQDLSRAYGDGLILFRIEQLSPERYAEVEVRGVRFTRWRGPHTLNVRGDRAVVDLYRDRFSLIAGLRRLRQSRSA